MSDGLAVSVLDLVGMRKGESAGSAIARSVELARHVEGLGYRRFWLAEHHSIEGLACSATSVLIGHVAGATSTIRVGSGGIMLPNHAPLVVAEKYDAKLGKHSPASRNLQRTLPLPRTVPAVSVISDAGEA